MDNLKLSVSIGDQRTAMLVLNDLSMLGEAVRVLADFDGDPDEQFDRSTMICGLGRVISALSAGVYDHFDRAEMESLEASGSPSQPAQRGVR